MGIGITLSADVSEKKNKWNNMYAKESKFRFVVHMLMR